MKIGDVRAMSADEIEDKILELKKEQFNLASRKRRGSSRGPRAFASCAATSRA